MARVATGLAFERVEGTMGDYSVVRGRSGPVARRKPTYRRPTSPGQAAQAARMKVASALWQGISDAAAIAWGAYAEGVVKRSDVSGQAYHPTGYNAFMELTLRALQASPTLTPPSLPPKRRFWGDDATVTVAPGAEIEGTGPFTPTPLPRREEGPGTGVLRFAASAPNGPGVAVEILVQRLVNARRKPQRQYKSRAFVRFVEEGLTFDLPVAPGSYACATRQVDPITGQAMGLIPLGVATVG